MKYSFLIPFYNRTKEFKYALDTYSYWYKARCDYEILIGSDIKNREMVELSALLSKYPELKCRHIEQMGELDCIIPCKIFNQLALLAAGDWFILTNPEIVHLDNILDAVDKNQDADYLVFACEAGYVDNSGQTFPDLKYRPYMWYQHSVHNNRGLHFCSAIRREVYFGIGGFDEAYSKGIGYDDNDLIQKIKTLKISYKVIDSAKVLHIEHDRLYQGDKEKIALNRGIFMSKWRINIP